MLCFTHNGSFRRRVSRLFIALVLNTDTGMQQTRENRKTEKLAMKQYKLALGNKNIQKSKSKPRPEGCKSCSFVCAYDCAHLQYNSVNLPSYPQTIPENSIVSTVRNLFTFLKLSLRHIKFFLQS